MTGREVEGIPGLEDLVVVSETKGELALRHKAPVRTLAAVIRHALEQGSLIDVLTEGQKVHGVAA